MGSRFFHLACQGGIVPLGPVGYATYQAHFKQEQPQVLSADSHVTIGTIQQIQDAAKVLCVYRHNSRHAASPTVILRFMEICWKTLALSPWNLIGSIKLNFMNNQDKFFMNVYWNDRIYCQCSLLYAQGRSQDFLRGWKLWKQKALKRKNCLWLEYAAKEST